MKVLFAALLLTGFSPLVAAADKACLLEGSFTMMGVTTDIKDCLMNTGVAQDMFIENCKGMAAAGAAFGAAPAKVTYLGACPAGQQAACEGLFGAPMTAYYYKRDAQSLADTRQGCLAAGGTWR